MCHRSGSKALEVKVHRTEYLLKDIGTYRQIRFWGVGVRALDF